MDAIGLQTLRAEVEADLDTMAQATVLASERLSHPGPAGAEAAAHHLCRFYNAFEQSALRIAKAFENNIDDSKGWHSTVLGRMFIEIPGVRPAVLPRALKPGLDEIRGFRHVVVHAYDLVIDPDKVRIVACTASGIESRVREAVLSFFDSVAALLRVDSGV